MNHTPLFQPPMFDGEQVSPCVKCEGSRFRTSAKGGVICADCEKARGRRRKARRRRERGERCHCGTDATSLNPDEEVVHNWGGGPCRVVPIGRP